MVAETCFSEFFAFALERGEFARSRSHVMQNLEVCQVAVGACVAAQTLLGCIQKDRLRRHYDIAHSGISETVLVRAREAHQ
ncbi:hypothetical protein WJX77_005094 [Trebouxia sp. C0004]